MVEVDGGCGWWRLVVGCGGDGGEWWWRWWRLVVEVDGGVW